MKLTEWYSGDQKPVRVGVYERDYSEEYQDNEIGVYCRWDGERWYVYDDSIEASAKQWVVTTMQSLPWRGIAK